MMIKAQNNRTAKSGQIDSELLNSKGIFCIEGLSEDERQNRNGVKGWMNTWRVKERMRGRRGREGEKEGMMMVVRG